MPLPIETGPDETRAHPHHTGRSRLDLVLALAAIFISLVSLFVAVEHGRIEQKLLAASTWPFLQYAEEDGPDDIRVIIDNAGVGPAKLVSLRMTLDGRVLKDIDAFAEACCGKPATSLDRLSSSSFEDSVMRPGQRNVVLRFDRKPDEDATERSIKDTIRRLRWEACYCSVFDECWVSDLVGLRTRPVRTCPAVPGSFNAQYFRH